MINTQLGKKSEAIFPVTIVREFLRIIRKLLRASAIVLHIILGALLTAVFVIVFRLNSNHLIYKHTTRLWLLVITKLVGLKIHVSGNFQEEKIKEQSVMYVSNHISWLDIPMLAGLTNPRFLSKQSVRNWPIIGWIAEKSGTIFISRGNSNNSGKNPSTVKQLTKTFESGNSVLIFPEGTTTEGHDVRRFHGRLFSSVIETETPVQPIAIKYFDKHGNLNTAVPFIGEQSFVDNLWSILNNKYTYAEVCFLDPITSNNKTRNELAHYCETTIRNKLNEMRIIS